MSAGSDDRKRGWEWRLSATFTLDVERYFPRLSPELANYVVHCSEQLGVFYVEVPKAASSSVKKLLQLAEVGGDVQALRSLGGNMHKRYHSPIPTLNASGLRIGDVNADPRYFKFAFVRNPFSRLLSCYLDKIARPRDEPRRLKLGFDAVEPVSLLRFLEALTEPAALLVDTHWMPQVYLLEPERIDWDFIGRFERIDDDLRVVIERLTTLPAQQQTMRVDPHRTDSDARVAEMIGPAEAELIRHIFAEDFRAFGYATDPVPVPV